MKAILEKSSARGHSHIDWLDTYYSFSYGEYHNPERMKFGMIRFLNDYTVAIDKTIQIHNDKNIILVTLPLKGSLHHSDSYGHEDMVRWGEAQIMNTGIGTVNSKYTNKSEYHLLEFIQIGILPEKMDSQPSHKIIEFLGNLKEHHFSTIISPEEFSSASIDQQVWISIGEFHHGDSADYTIHNKNNGIFIFLLGGNMTLSNYHLETKDSLEISDTDKVTCNFNKNSTVLIIETPL